MSPTLTIGMPLARRHWRVLLWDRFISGLRIGIIFALVVTWGRQQQIPADQLGLIYSFSGLGSVISSACCERLARRYGKRQVMLGGAWFAVLGWALMVYSHDLRAMCLAQALAGAGLSAAIITNDAYVGAHTPEERRARHFAFALAFRGLGICAGPLLFAALGSIALTCWLVVGLLLLTQLLVTRYLPESVLPLADEDVPVAQALAAPQAVWRKIWPGLVLWALFFTGEAFIGRYVPIHAQDALAAPDWLVTVIFSSMGLTMVTAPPLIRLAGKVLQAWQIAVLGLLTVGGLSLLCALTHNAIVIAVWFILWGAFWDVICPFLTGFTSRSVTAAEQTQAMALQSAGTATVTLFAPALAGWLYGIGSSGGLFSLAALLFTAAAALGFRLRGRFGMVT